MDKPYRTGTIFKLPERLRRKYEETKYGLIIEPVNEGGNPEYSVAAYLKSGTFVPLAEERVRHEEVKKLNFLERLVFGLRTRRGIRISVHPLIHEEDLN